MAYTPTPQAKLMSRAQQAGVTPEEYMLQIQNPDAFAPLSGEQYQELVNNLSQVPSIQAQRQNIAGQAELGAIMAGRELQRDLSPVASLIDTFSGGKTQLAKNYVKPLSEDERQDLLTKINSGINKAYSELSDSEVAILKAQLGLRGVLGAAETKAGATTEAAKITTEGGIKKAEIGAASADKKTATTKPSDQKKVDADFGTAVYRPWISGGAAQSKSYIDTMESAYGTLSKDPEIVGALKGSIPARPVTNPKLQDLMDTVYSQAVSSIKESVGGAPSQRESELILQLAINPKLPASMNMKRLKRLTDFAKAKRRDVERAIKHYETHNRSLEGFVYESDALLSEKKPLTEQEIQRKKELEEKAKRK